MIGIYCRNDCDIVLKRINLIAETEISTIIGIIFSTDLSEITNKEQTIVIAKIVATSKNNLGKVTINDCIKLYFSIISVLKLKIFEIKFSLFNILISLIDLVHA